MITVYGAMSLISGHNSGVYDLCHCNPYFSFIELYFICMTLWDEPCQYHIWLISTSVFIISKN